MESQWANDSQHLLLEHFDIIQNSPFHIYHSAIPLFPSSSLLHKCYNAEPSAMVKVVKGLPTEWGVCSRTVFLDSITWTLSHHNSSIAIGSNSGDIIILDSTTGTQRAALSGHTNTISCVEFSSDGTFLVSGSSDGTIKLWDIQTGGVVRTFSGRTKQVQYISISVDCTKIVSGSHDYTMCLWDIQTGKCHCITEGNMFPPWVRFSPTNSQYFISISIDHNRVHRIQHWDTNGQQIKPLHYAFGAAFSPDGTQLFSCYKGVATVCNLNSGVILSTFHVGDDYPTDCCFSPDGRLVAVATDNIIHIWDITSSAPHLVRTLTGHVHKVVSIIFSSPSTLISASGDKSVKFWDVYTLSPKPAMSGLESPIALPLVSSISLQVREGVAISSSVAGEIKTWDVSTSLHGIPTQTSTKDSRYGGTKQANSRLIFVWYLSEMLHVWNAEKGEFILQLHIPKHNTLDLRISGDGSKIFHISNNFIQVWDIWTGVTMGTVEYKDIEDVSLLAIDGSRVWVKHSVFDYVWPSIGWDFGTLDSSPVELSADPPARLYLSNTKFWDTSLCGILDTVTGKVVFQLPAQFGRPVDVQYNGQYLVASFKSKEELVLELHPQLLK